MAFDTSLFAAAFVTVLVVMDPLGNVPVFLSLTRSFTPQQRRRAAWQGAAVATGVILSFAIFGQQVLHLLGISLPALQVAGGLLLLIVALELLNPADGGVLDPASDTNLALVPLGTPLLAGPGAIAATMVYVREADGATGGILAVLAALAAVLLVCWVALRYSSVVARVLRDNGIHLLSRVMGLLVAAIAVQLVATAIQEWIDNGVA